MIEVKVSFDPDPERATQDTRFWSALALSAEEKSTTDDPRELESLGEALPLQRVASRWIVSSDVRHHVDMVSEYVAMGFNHLVFHSPARDQRRFISLYGELVLPRLRDRWGAFSSG
jgi:coenzyme F420-dependent glucose-6-phosphate dehydrogenase